MVHMVLLGIAWYARLEIGTANRKNFSAKLTAQLLNMYGLIFICWVGVEGLAARNIITYANKHSNLIIKMHTH